jgi:4-diphosphocytidyl-2-C-methyl-D-erythritol kinase
MRFLTLASPAKLNLVLRILGRRPDGYHDLCTLFHRISLCDTLYLKKRKEGVRLLCSHPRVPKRNNLVVRAFRLLKARRPFPGGVTVRLTKRIPVGGGLGGGSGNAAAFLVGMNRLFRLGLSLKELMELGGELGSDIPFFISGTRHAIGKGRGERIQGVPFRRRLWFLLILSPRGLAAKKVYQNFRSAGRPLSLTRISRDVKLASAFLERGELGRATAYLSNDLTESTERIQPSLRKTRERLSGLHLGTCQMSGSGPTQFLIFTSPAQARRAIRQLRRLDFSKRVRLCHSF